MAGDFRLSAALQGHEEDVRAVVWPSRNTLFSASRDNTVRQWQLTAPKPPTYDDCIVLQGSHWYNGIAFAPPSKQYPNGAIAAGGKETFVFVKHVGQSLEEDPHRLLIGHAGNITCVAFSEDGSKVISGGWDSQAFVWDVEAGNVTAELEGHGGPVWGILVYDARFILTACADKVIRLFDINGKSLQAFQGHTDVVRCFVKLPDGHASGAAIASAGNDEVIRLWTLDGKQAAVLEGHNAYIYSLAILPNGDIVSSSEDRTVKIWRNAQCIQTITHPAISIWTVAACPETGDIVSGASDNVVRLFSRDPERQADPQVLKEFDERNRMYAIPAETATQGQPFEKETLPGPEELQSKVGDRDGQQLFIRENDGSVTAHLWSASTSQWNLIGTVVSGEGSGSSKKVYEGKEYDYVFDIDIEDGKPPLKLPYNLTENAWDAARKFLERNELPLSYYEQVANWLTENTRGAKFGRDTAPSQQAPSQGHDAWGTEKRYRPGDAGPTSSGSLPQRKYLDIIEGNPLNAINLICKKTDELKSSGDITAEQSLQSDDVQALQALSTQLQNKTDPKPTAAQTSPLFKVATQWPTKSRVPAVGVLALCAVSPDFVNTASNGTVIETLSSANLFAPRQETANNVVHAIRLLVNLFKSDPGRHVIAKSFDNILSLVRPYATEPESPAQAKALATLYVNLAVLLISDSKPSNATTKAKALLTDIAVLLECENPHAAADAEILSRALIALGTLLFLSDEFRRELKPGVAGSLHFVATKPLAKSSEMVQRVLQELRDLLR